MNNSDELDQFNQVAVVGLSGRFPGAGGVEEFWANLRDGVESITTFSDEELIAAGVEPALLKHSSYVKAAAALGDVSLFDASFFGFSPREAETTDPQHRLFLECSWEALENAGYDSETYRGSIGVFAGSGMNSYSLNVYSNRAVVASVGPVQTKIGNDKDHLPTRVSYKLNLRGPSVTVQTACSTSLVAVHLACQSLLNGECDMALAGGVTLVLPQKSGYFYQEGSILSPDGHCRAFDEGAQGVVGGSGAGVVVLKRLADALADGDTVHAVIRGSAVNNDGSAKVGYTAPSVRGQAEVIAECLSVARTAPETITYIEAHGTGTPLGDPIEIEALTQSMRAFTDRRGFCAVGSVKTNIGHLDTAAGVAGLIKTVLALRHKQLPPSLNYTRPNPRIDFASSPFYVNTKLSPWAANGTPRRAGVSSFGIGGTNAHVILEEAPAVEPSGPSRPWQVLPLSAKTDAALERATRNLEDFFKTNPDASVPDVAFTLQTGRRAFSRRRVALCRNTDEAVAALGGQAPHLLLSSQHEGSARPVVFMFPGQGSQRVGMCRELYEAEEVFRHHVDRCRELLRPHLGLDLRELIYPPAADEAEAAERLRQTAFTQPALFAVEYALAQLWMAWGVRPAALLGHSLGEYVAACVAGVFSLEDALRLVALRGRLMQSVAGGAMLAVGLSEEETAGALGRGLWLAAVNARQQCVVSGETEAVAALESSLRGRGVWCRRLEVSHAFHSGMMEPVVEAFAEEVREVELKKPELPYISNVSGRWATEEEARDAAYWGRQMREAVRFGAGVARAVEEFDAALLEVGPGQQLSRMARRESGAAVVVATFDGEPAAEAAQPMRALGRLWLGGAEIDWTQLHAGARRQRLPLPTYPFERQRYWLERQMEGLSAGDQLSTPAGAKKTDIADWFYVPAWKRTVMQGAARRAGGEARPERWLVFLDEVGVGRRLSDMLERSGEEVIRVEAGAAFEQSGADLYRLDPEASDDYDRLVSRLYAGGRRPTRIVHLWNVTADSEAQAGRGTRVEQVGGRSFYSLVWLAQALGRRVIERPGEAAEPVELLILSNNMQEVSGDEPLEVEKSLLLGPCRVIPREYPHVSCRSVDFVLPAAGGRQQQRLLEQLAGELRSGSGDTTVAYRGGHRWVQTFEEVRLEQEGGERPRRIREGGTYLITGGLGGVGLALAGHLAEVARAKLILVGRRGLPAREKWDELLGDENAGEVRAQIAKIRQMEKAGAEVEVLGADVSDEAEMREVLRRGRERFGAIRGVIHAAGVAPHGLIQLKTRELSAAILRPKVEGALVLDALLACDQLDFVIFCSSQRSFIGLPGGADYSAANAFLDAFALRLSGGGKGFVASINWDTWLETGMAVAPGGRAEVTRADGMLTAEGVDAFCRVLNCSLPQLIVSTQDFRSRLVPDTNLEPSDHLEQLRKKQDANKSLHPRPQLSTDYVPPRNETEQAIADIWQKLLGIERIGVDDNFFELGGDSVTSIQFTARANEQGLRLTPAQVFERPTVAELAAAAGTAQSVQAEQGLVTGALPLTPVQRRFFEQPRLNRHHYNQALLLEVRRAVDLDLLEAGLRHLLRHHDALRMRFVEKGSGWEQVNGDDLSLAFDRIDLAGMTEDGQRAAIEAIAAETQAGLDISRGPLVRVSFFDLGEGKAGRLLFVAHHLIIDAISWRVLLEDLQTVCRQLAAREPVSLPAKTTSFKLWAESLGAYADSPQLAAELPYWLSASGRDVRPLPLDFAAPENTEESVRGVSVSLDEAETLALLQRVPAVFRTRINDVLLAAVAETIRDWTGAARVLVEVEGHGREPLAEGVDVSRTVGWFTSLYPVSLDCEGAGTAVEVLKSVKEQLREVPGGGVGYGLLRYMSAEGAERLRVLPRPEISLLYLGQFDQSINEASLFSPAREFSGNTCDPRETRSHLFEVVGSVNAGRLKMTWRFSEKAHRLSTVERLADGFVRALREIIAHCAAPDAHGFTPSDFSEADLDQRELDALLEELSAE